MIALSPERGVQNSGGKQHQCGGRHKADELAVRYLPDDQISRTDDPIVEQNRGKFDQIDSFAGKITEKSEEVQISHGVIAMDPFPVRIGFQGRKMTVISQVIEPWEQGSVHISAEIIEKADPDDERQAKYGAESDP